LFDSTPVNLATDQLEILMATSHDAIIRKTIDGIITAWNPGAEQMYGYTAQEIIGQHVTLIMPDDEFPGIMERLQRGEMISRYETQRRHKDGRLLAISLIITPLKDAQGTVVGALSIAHDITGQKQALSVLKQREEYFTLLAETIPQLVWTTRPDGYIDYYNQRWYDYTGLSVEESSGWGWKQVLHPDDLQPTLSIWQHALQSGCSYEVEYRLKRAFDGSYRWHLGRSLPLRDTSGIILKWFGTCTDIDDWKRADLLVRQSAQFRLITEHARDLICMISVEGTLEYVSPSYQQALGYAPETIVHQPYLDLIHPDEHPLFLTGRDSDRSVQFRMQCADGSWRWMEGSWSDLFWQGQPYVAGVAHDITERKELDQRNEELRLSGERFKQFMNANIIGVVINDEHAILDANDAFFKLVGYSKEELEHGRINWSLITAPEYVSMSQKAVEELQVQGAFAPFEKEYVRKDGTRVSVLVGAARLQAEPPQWVTFILDLSVQKLLEHQLEAQNVALREQYLRAEKASRLKSEFLANMSHELRTPLNAIIGFADLLAAGIVVPPKEAQKEYLADILSSGRHLLQLVSDVLDLSKIQAGKMVFRPEPVELNVLISNVCEIMRPLVVRKQLQITTDMDPTVTGVMIDPARFKQVLYNYLSNAIKFTPQEGKIWVRIRAEPPDTFRLEVEDTGIGIAPEDIGRLFVEFQQLDISASKKYQGTGLGLALTKRLIEAQEGHVGVLSQPGQGSIFFAILPRVTSISQESLAESDAYLHRAAAPGAPSLLIIDDEVQDQQRLARVCTAAGYQVEVASTGVQALERCRHTAFAAITLDLILPDMDGWEVLRAIRAGGPNREVPIVVITLVEEKSVAAAFTIQGVLTKPILTEEVLHVLDQLKPTAKPEISGSSL
jgi:PAS domain S-box-containing protein